jgi:GT2 family glycosyltransferase
MTSKPPGAGAARRVVVAVISWNTRELLDRCLRSLRPWSESGEAQVWVVDNASSDGSAQLVQDEHPWVHLEASQENLGYGRAINLVADRTDSRWLAIANADIALRDGALDRLLAAGEADAGAGIVAPRLVLPDGSTQHSVWAFPTIGATTLQNLGTRVVRGAWDADRPRRVPWAVGAFLVIRRAAWDQIGGFDPGQWMSAEDLDLGWRMHRAGWATRYEPTAVVEHEESAATGEVWGADLPIHWQRCAYSWMVRRRGRLVTAAVGLLNFAGSAARYVRARARDSLRSEESTRALGRWTLVHFYALAPRRTLDRYR